MRTAASEAATAVFLALSSVPPDQRAAVLEEKCGGDEALRREVERLLAGLDLPDAFLEPAESWPSTQSKVVPQPEQEEQAR